MIFTKGRAAVAAVLVAGGAGVLAAAAPAVAFISPPLVLLGEAQSPGRLVAWGAAVDVTVEYSCTADRMYLGVQLAEKVGKKVAGGSGSTSVPCDGATHRVLVQVTANSGGPAFARGTAVANTSVSGCRVRKDKYLCGDDLVTRTIQLRK
jgi:hypothetical protein